MAWQEQLTRGNEVRSFPSPLVSYHVEKTFSNGRHFASQVTLPAGELFRLQDIFDQDDYRLPDSYDPRGQLILDVGANAGLFALYMVGQFPQCAIHCYEPAPATFSLLEGNTRQFPNISTHPVALGKHNGRKLFFLDPVNSGQNSFKPFRLTATPIKVECRDASAEFDRIAPDRVGILKLDTEGSEVAILESLASRLARADVVMVEYHSPTDRRRIEELLGDFVPYSVQEKNESLGVLKYANKSLVL